MYLTNNKDTIFNLILYSESVYLTRDLQFKIQNYYMWDGYYINEEPYGNIDKEVLLHIKKIGNNRCI